MHAEEEKAGKVKYKGNDPTEPVTVYLPPNVAEQEGFVSSWFLESEIHLRLDKHTIIHLMHLIDSWISLFAISAVWQISLVFEFRRLQVLLVLPVTAQCRRHQRPWSRWHLTPAPTPKILFFVVVISFWDVHAK